MSQPFLPRLIHYDSSLLPPSPPEWPSASGTVVSSVGPVAGPAASLKGGELWVGFGLEGNALLVELLGARAECQCQCCFPFRPQRTVWGTAPVHSAS